MIVPRLLALAAVATALAGAAVLASNDPAGTPFCGPVCLDQRLAALIGIDGRLDPARLGPSRTLVREQLALSPFETSAWVRLAAVEAEANGGRINAAANQALEASYRYAPVHIQTARGRLAFVFDHWTEVAPAVRVAAQREMRSLSVSTPNFRALSAIAPEIRNPSGRLAFRLLVDQLAQGR